MTAKQIKDLLNNMSKNIGVNAQILQRNFMMERLLKRIALSEYKDDFILKGGMLVSAMVGIYSSATIDLHASIRNTMLTEESIEKIFQDLIHMDMGDEITMKIKEIEEIREGFEESCYHVSMTAEVDDTIIPMKVEISTGNMLTPAAVNYKFDLLLENRSIEVWAYNLETILAEKMETIISRYIFNARMRDFFDVYILAKNHSQDIDLQVLANAIDKTAERRKTKIDYAELEADISYIFLHEGVQKLWKAYQKKSPYAQDISWNEINNVIVKLFMDIKSLVFLN